MVWLLEMVILLSFALSCRSTFCFWCRLVNTRVVFGLSTSSSGSLVIFMMVMLVFVWRVVVVILSLIQLVSMIARCWFELNVVWMVLEFLWVRRYCTPSVLVFGIVSLWGMVLVVISSLLYGSWVLLASVIL